MSLWLSSSIFHLLNYLVYVYCATFTSAKQERGFTIRTETADGIWPPQCPQSQLLPLFWRSHKFTYLEFALSRAGVERLLGSESGDGTCCSLTLSMVIFPRWTPPVKLRRGHTLLFKCCRMRLDWQEIIIKFYTLTLKEDPTFYNVHNFEEIINHSTNHTVIYMNPTLSKCFRNIKLLIFKRTKVSCKLHEVSCSCSITLHDHDSSLHVLPSSLIRFPVS